MIFADKFKGIEEDKYVLHSAPEYYDMIAKCTNKIEMWITDYCHEMDKNVGFCFLTEKIYDKMSKNLESKELEG